MMNNAQKERADEWLQAHWDELATEFPDQWVAVTETGTVFNNASIGALADSVADKNGSALTAVYAFMEPKM